MAISAPAPFCTLRRVYFTWLLFGGIYVGGLVFLAVRGTWVDLAAWLVILPASQWTVIQLAPRLRSRARSNENQLPAQLEPAKIPVTIYTALGCPYCPGVHQRLERLQAKMGFDLKTVDLTLQPKLAAERGIRSVPVVECGGQRLVGNASAEAMSRLISQAASAAAHA